MMDRRAGYSLAEIHAAKALRQRVAQKDELRNLLPALSGFNTMLDATGGSIIMFVPTNMRGRAHCDATWSSMPSVGTLPTRPPSVSSSNSLQEIGCACSGRLRSCLECDHGLAARCSMLPIFCGTGKTSTTSRCAPSVLTLKQTTAQRWDEEVAMQAPLVDIFLRKPPAFPLLR